MKVMIKRYFFASKAEARIATARVGGEAGGGGLLRKKNRNGIFKLLRSPGIDSASLCSLAGRYDNPYIPTRFLSSIHCYKD
jgi:hypothetical protein